MADRTLAIIGAGYVGLVTAVGFTHAGHRVRLGEVDPARVARLRAGEVPIHEGGLPELLHDARRSGLLTFHDDNVDAIDGAEAVFFTVPTPQGPTGAADLSFLEAAIRSVAGRVGPGTALVVKSSVPPGSWRAIQAVLDDVGSGGSLVMNPEFLQEGSAVDNVLHPARVVIGSHDQRALDVVADLHASTGSPIVRTDPASAELTKYASNSYLATRLTFVNSIAHFSESVGADVQAVLRGMGLDPRIGEHYLRPGPGYGGSCFPKDLRALVHTADALQHDLKLLRAVVDTNDDQLDRVVGKVAAAVDGDLGGVRVGLWGLAFKADTDDVRGSPAVAIAERLLDHGAKVTAYDPAASVDLPGMISADSALEAAAGADVLLVATEWWEFTEVRPAKLAEVMEGDAVVDARNLLDKKAVVEAGLRYSGLGR